MSVISKDLSHRRNDSGEIVVFDAARYFSGVDESRYYHNSGKATARMSLDMPTINAHDLPTIQKQYNLMREKKKYKQPSSPGGRLASFLNSLFNQTNSKKKKKKSKISGAAAEGGGDHDDRHAHDRRRSSISHFRITAAPSADDYSAAVLRQNPHESSYRELKSFSDRQKAAVSMLKNGEGAAGNERLRFNNGSFRNPTTKWTAGDEDERKFVDGDDGEDSDSSSDLFDLPNLDFYASGLPVYGTTDMDRIQIGAPATAV